VGSEITKRQIKAIWTLAHRSGLLEEDLRLRMEAAWGKKSIRSLTQREARELIERLLIHISVGKDARPAMTGSRDAPSASQMAFIEGLAGRLEWDSWRLNRLARRMYGVRSLEDLKTRQASGLIEALKAIQKRSAVEGARPIRIGDHAA
jgi:hypothetical protein